MSNLLKMIVLAAGLAAAFKPAGAIDVGNGRFAFSEGAEKILDRARDELVPALRRIDAKLMKDFDSRVAKRRLIELIKHVRKDYHIEALGLNSHGKNEPKLFTYGHDEKGDFILAPKLFFIAFMERELSVATLERVKEILIHEACHIFGLNDTEALIFAGKILNAIAKPEPKTALIPRRPAPALLSALKRPEAKQGSDNDDYAEEYVSTIEGPNSTDSIMKEVEHYRDNPLPLDVIRSLIQATVVSKKSSQDTWRWIPALLALPKNDRFFALLSLAVERDLLNPLQEYYDYSLEYSWYTHAREQHFLAFFGNPEVASDRRAFELLVKYGLDIKEPYESQMTLSRLPPFAVLFALLSRKEYSQFEGYDDAVAQAVAALKIPTDDLPSDGGVRRWSSVFYSLVSAFRHPWLARRPGAVEFLKAMVLGREYGFKPPKDEDSVVQKINGSDMNGPWYWNDVAIGVWTSPAWIKSDFTAQTILDMIARYEKTFPIKRRDTADASAVREYLMKIVVKKGLPWNPRFGEIVQAVYDSTFLKSEKDLMEKIVDAPDCERRLAEAVNDE